MAPRTKVLVVVLGVVAAATAAYVAWVWWSSHAPPPVVEYVDAPPSEKRRKECAKRKGEFRILGSAGIWVCVVPYADGGKMCRDGSECEGKICKARSDGTGACIETSDETGCYAEIYDGKAGMLTCTD